MMTNQEWEELQSCYMLIQDSIRLAEKTLLAGGVKLIDQKFFWSSYQKVELYCDIDDEDELVALNNRIDELNPGYKVQGKKL